MITAVDTSALLAIVKAESDALAWVDVLLRARRDGELVVCDVVAAELFAVLLSETKFRRVLLDVSIEFSPITVESAKLAGRVFRAYRHAGGPRQHLVPDFLIAAHAAVQADQIAARDRGYMRRYFPRLRIVAPQ